MGRGIWLLVEKPGCREVNSSYRQVTGNMGTEVIRISVVAKDSLEARKRADESFTDVIKRLTDQSVDVERFIRRYASADLEAGVEATKERLDQDLRRSDERMEE